MVNCMSPTARFCAACGVTETESTLLTEKPEGSNCRMNDDWPSAFSSTFGAAATNGPGGPWVGVGDGDTGLGVTVGGAGVGDRGAGAGPGTCVTTGVTLPA